MYDLAPGSLFLLRLPSALAAATTTVLAALVAREVGGGRRAQLIAAGCTAASGFALAVGHFVTTTTFDVLSTTAFRWLVVRALVRRRRAVAARGRGRRRPRLRGEAAGRPRRTRPVVGAARRRAALAAPAPGGRRVASPRPSLLVAPYAVWQQLHGWPQLTVAGNIGGSAEGGRAGFIPFQLVMVSPVLVPVWVAGLLAPFRRAALEAAPLPADHLRCAGGRSTSRATARPTTSRASTRCCSGSARSRPPTGRGARGCACGLVTAAIAVSAVVSAFIALPLLPERSLQGSVVMALNPDQGETVGWPRFVDTVARRVARDPAGRARAHRDLHVELRGGRRRRPARPLARAAAGLQRPQRLQRVGAARPTPTRTRSSSATTPAAPRPYFTGCRPLATIDNGVGLDNDEQGGPVLLCRTTAPWSKLWAKLRRYD